MISLESIEQSIIELESKDTTFTTCERLAWLYIVRNNLKNYQIEKEKAIDVSGQSEFLSKINGKNPKETFAKINDFVEAVKVLHPRMYQKFIDEL